MNALANATAHALAHGTANAMSARSVHAKRSEVKGPDLKGPDLKFFVGLLQVQNVTYVTRETATLGLGGKP